MFIIFGKLIAERYQILNHREEILSGKVKKLKPPPVFATNRPKINKNNITEELLLAASSEKDIPASPKKKTKKKNTYAFLSQSREEFNKATECKKLVPPCGIYDCKYSLVYKSVQVSSFKKRSATKSRRKNIQSISEIEISPEKIKAKIQSPIPFEKQKPRPLITAFTKDVHESRFIKFDDMPEHCSKYKRACTPNMEKTSERSILFKLVQHSPDYSPNFKLVTSDIGKVIQFEKYSSRKDDSTSGREDMRQYKPNYAMVEKRICAPDFTKATSRPKSATPLPCFMKNVSWREAIDMMNEKSLEMNNCIDKESIYNSIHS